VNGNQLSVADLNARRRQAVLLRLNGEKLAAVTDTTGLSAPTVIAAVKAYRQGGWEAVDVRPRRGRPALDEQGIPAPVQDRLLAAMQAGAPQGHDLWNRQAVLEWLASDGCMRSAGVVGRWCEGVGLGGDDIPESERAGGVLRLHGVERSGFICVKAPRGKLLWVAFGDRLEARHYIALLEKLLPAKEVRVELRIAGSSRLARVPQLRDWLAVHEGGLRLVDPQGPAPPPPPSLPPEGGGAIRRLSPEGGGAMRRLSPEGGGVKTEEKGRP
jgi:sulfate adenylyltransferase subunit 2